MTCAARTCRLLPAPGFDDLFPAERSPRPSSRPSRDSDRPRTRRPTCARHRGRAREVPARVLRAGAVPDEVYLVIAASRRPRRLRRALPRGRPRRALRARRCRAAVRVPPPRRQLGHGGLRVPVRAPDGGPGWLAASLGAMTRSGWPLRRLHPREQLVFLRRYAAKLSYELELHGGRAAAGPDPALYLRAGSATRWASTGPRPAYLADVDGGSTPRTTCARGRRDTPAGCCSSASARWFLRARPGTCCARSGDGQRIGRRRAARRR